MIILGIETSCDDTCAAIVKTEPINDKSRLFDFNLEKNNFKILSNIVSSQVKIHKKYGGVFPSMAKREHQKNIALVVEKAVKKAKIKGKKEKPNKIKEKELKNIFIKDDSFFKSSLSFLEKNKKPQIDALSVTIGPGLEPCLWQGINFAKALSLWWDIPIIPANHIEGHIMANFILPQKNLKSAALFPAICLIVSGGHTQLILMEEFKKYKILGETRDDAAGECLDKAARILGLGYPGGPAIAEQAQKYSKAMEKNSGDLKTKKHKIKVEMPRPMIFSKNYDFSFSGLKTAALYDFKKRDLKTKKSKDYIQLMSYEIQKAINDTLIYKTLKAAKFFEAKSIIIGGGVSANAELKKSFSEQISKLSPSPAFLFPKKNLSADNAAMICAASLLNQDKILRGRAPGYSYRSANASRAGKVCLTSAPLRYAPGYHSSPGQSPGIFRQLNKKIGWKNIQADANLRIK